MIPLSLDNTLLEAVIRFGSSNEDEVAFIWYPDSCTDMDTAYSLLHMWIMTIYPDIVASYERFDDKDPFQPIILDYVVPLSIADKDLGQLSVVVTYKTCYTDKDGKKMITLSVD